MIPAVTNPQDEAQRLRELYAGMSDGELERIATAAYDLTEQAYAALQVEIANRHLAVQVNDEPPGYEQPEFRDTITIAKYRDLSEAMFAKGLLDGAGIECFLADDNMTRMNWFYANALGGIRLQVRPEDAEEAARILDQPAPESFEVEGAGAFEQPRCPKCDSRDVRFESLNKPISYTSAWLGFPLPIGKNNWKCDACGHEWQDDSEEPAPR
jgi:hypothetical protein